MRFTGEVAFDACQLARSFCNEANSREQNPNRSPLKKSTTTFFQELLLYFLLRANSKQST
jgi:hypothetical protein